MSLWARSWPPEGATWAMFTPSPRPRGPSWSPVPTLPHPQGKRVGEKGLCPSNPQGSAQASTSPEMGARCTGPPLGHGSQILVTEREPGSDLSAGPGLQGEGAGGRVEGEEGGQGAGGRKGRAGREGGGGGDGGQRGRRGRTEVGSSSGPGLPPGDSGGFQVPAFVCGPELACQPRRQRPNLFFFAG